MWSKASDSRLGFSVLCSIVGIVVSAVFAGFLILISEGSFLSALRITYIIFGAPTGVVAILHLLFPSIEKIEYGLGTGGYYGGWATYWLLGFLGLPESGATVFVGYLISTLVCVIIAISYAKHQRDT